VSDGKRSFPHQVWWPEGGEDGPDDGATLDAVDHRHAAEKRARNLDQEEPREEYATWTFMVRAPFNGGDKEVTVTKHLDVRYRADWK